MTGACALGILLAAIAPAFGQAPGQVPGQTPSSPPIHIPHIGGSRQQRPQPETSTEGPVYVLLWFNVDDYILPQSDDAAKRIAVFLTQQGIPATFKVVGEEARELQQRQRQDVITALAQHDIGYYSNTHSQHPTVAEYEASLDWVAGGAEFSSREHAGFLDVARIFRKAPVAYGQPGASWAPQVFPVLQKWGVHVYLDEGRQVGFRGRPFWYGGLLNIFNTREGEQLRPNADWSNLDTAKARFQDIYLALTARKTGGVVSLHFSPSEFVEKELWNEVNFRDGANPPKEQWKLPPAKTPEDTEKAFQYFQDLVLFLKSFPNVQFITASGAAQRFRDRSQTHVFSSEDVAAIAGQVDSEVSLQQGDGFWLSASEVFYVIDKFLAGILLRKGSEPLVLDRTPYGPLASSPAMAAPLVAPWAQVARAVVDVRDEMDKTGQIPTAVAVGAQLIPPESFLVGISQAAKSLIEHAQPPESLTFAPARLAAADYVNEDSPDIWDWVIFPHGFHAPNLISIAKLQAWTLKPASR